MDETIELTLVYQGCTKDAICVSDNPASPDVWIPIDLVEEQGVVLWEDTRYTITLTIPVWLAEEKELI